MNIFQCNNFTVVLLSLWLIACSNTEDTAAIRKKSDISKILSGVNDKEFERVVKPRDFIFPQDHGAHPAYKSEWWYVTGNLEAENGQHFGVQLTIFRWGISPKLPQSESKWATNQLYMAHFTISDIKNNRYYSFERFSRASLELAGAQVKPFKVWLLDWSFQSDSEQFFPLVLNAKQDNISIRLQLKSLKPHVLQGDQGLSKKNATPGNASYYYSYTRLESAGELTINNEVFHVVGNSWLDREWSTSALSKSQLGWDWFALQLSNGEEIMFYQLRRKNDEVDESSAGSYIRKNGDVIKLAHNQVHIRPLTMWKSPSGAEYPNSWQLRIPQYNIELHIEPYMDNQEFNHSVRYWEGAVKIRGEINSDNINGEGYVELTGY